MSDRGWRAFIVPKSDSSKQQEIPVTDAELETVSRHEFRAKLGQGHNFIIGMNSESISSSFDGKDIRIIDTVSPEFDRLVKRPFDWTWTGNNSESHGEFTGDSWIISQKDLKTGRIEKFTQSGTSGLGRLEIIQGDPETEGGLDLGRNPKWRTNGETERTPKTSSSKLVSLPDDMKRDAVVERDSRYSMGERAFAALDNLVPNSIEQEIRQQNREIAAKLNIGDSRKQDPKGLGRSGLNF
jgi:hypothetical protein